MKNTKSVSVKRKLTVEDFGKAHSYVKLLAIPIEKTHSTSNEIAKKARWIIMSTGRSSSVFDFFKHEPKRRELTKVFACIFDGLLGP